MVRATSTSRPKFFKDRHRPLVVLNGLLIFSRDIQHVTNGAGALGDACGIVQFSGDPHTGMPDVPRAAHQHELASPPRHRALNSLRRPRLRPVRHKLTPLLLSGDGREFFIDGRSPTVSVPFSKSELRQNFLQPVQAASASELIDPVANPELLQLPYRQRRLLERASSPGRHSAVQELFTASRTACSSSTSSITCGTATARSSATSCSSASSSTLGFCCFL